MYTKRFRCVYLPPFSCPPNIFCQILLPQVTQHKPRYCVVCSRWFCGYCKRTNLLSCARTDPTKRRSFIPTKSLLDFVGGKETSSKSSASGNEFGSYLCTSGSCGKKFKADRAWYAAKPGDCGAGGVLEDVAAFVLLCGRGGG